MKEIIPPSESYPYPSLALDPAKIAALTESLMNAGFAYGLGAKIEPLSDQAEDVPQSQRKVDCSGFVRWAIYHALGCPTDYDVPDGSYNEHHQWADGVGFKTSDYAAGFLSDNAVRIAFLEPSQSPENIGHVLLLINGATCESHGSHGPDMRHWGALSFMRDMSLYVLSPPR